MDYVVGAYVGVLAETVLRMTEGLFSMEEAKETVALDSNRATTAGEKQGNEDLVTLGGFSGRLGTAVK